MLDNFCTKWHLTGIEDAGACVSEEFNKFAKELKTVLRSDAKSLGFNLADFSKGHYFVSGFFEKDGKYVYFSYDVPRSETPMDLTAKSAFDGVLYRTAKNCKDYTGGPNRFTSMTTLLENVETLLSKE